MKITVGRPAITFQITQGRWNSILIPITHQAQYSITDHRDTSASIMHQLPVKHFAYVKYNKQLVNCITDSPVVSKSERRTSRGSEAEPLCRLLIVRTMRGTICGFDKDLQSTRQFHCLQTATSDIKLHTLHWLIYLLSFTVHSYTHSHQLIVIFQVNPSQLTSHNQKCHLSFCSCWNP